MFRWLNSWRSWFRRKTASVVITPTATDPTTPLDLRDVFERIRADCQVKAQKKLAQTPAVVLPTTPPTTPLPIKLSPVEPLKFMAQAEVPGQTWFYMADADGWMNLPMANQLMIAYWWVNKGRKVEIEVDQRGWSRICVLPAGTLAASDIEIKNYLGVNACLPRPQPPV